MKGSLAVLAGLAGAALASPMPQASGTSGCESTYPGTFGITVVNITQSAKRDLETRQDGALTITLTDGIMKDQNGRQAEIVANRQFQFDKPLQSGAIYTSGWCVYGNGSLAINGNAVFYQCLSGNFYNLYDQSQGGQCAAIYIEVMGSGSASSSGAAPASSQAVSQTSDGQVQATTAVTQISDGQIQATTMMVTQISDGQIQYPTATGAKVSQISDGQVQATTGAKVSQISDGQVQATTATGAKVSQISDGQVQATTATGAKVSQISDGQVQATTATGAKVSQISDGQVQATTATGAKVSQISDGQVQATTSAAKVSQISDGQIQATTGAAVSQISDGQVQATTAAVATYTGAAAPARELSGGFAFVAGLVGAVAML